MSTRTGHLWFVAVGECGAASFDNDPAADWFFLVEEAVDPGALIASTLDVAVGEAGYLGLDASCEAIAAAELSASCARQDNRWLREVDDLIERLGQSGAGEPATLSP